MQQQDTAHSATPPRVRVVDDDHTLTRTLAQLLSSEGLQVDVAQDGEEALERVHTECPLLVIGDVHMPSLDGYGFIDGFREVPNCAETRSSLRPLEAT